LALCVLQLNAKPLVRLLQRGFLFYLRLPRRLRFMPVPYTRLLLRLLIPGRLLRDRRAQAGVCLLRFCLRLRLRFSGLLLVLPGLLHLALLLLLHLRARGAAVCLPPLLERGVEGLLAIELVTCGFQLSGCPFPLIELED
jgi:hypothetical protein